MGRLQIYRKRVGDRIAYRKRHLGEHAIEHSTNVGSCDLRRGCVFIGYYSAGAKIPLGYGLGHFVGSRHLVEWCKRKASEEKEQILYGPEVFHGHRDNCLLVLVVRLD